MRPKIKGGIKSQKTFFIFGEGETEKCYFSAISEYLKDNASIKFLIEPIKNGQIGPTYTKLKITKNRILNILYQEYGLNESYLLKINSKVFILLDIDGNNGYSIEQINTIKTFFKDDKLITVLFSNRDFELYILLHLQYYNGCDLNYIGLIKKYYKDFEKGENIKLKNIHREIIKNGFNSTLPKNIIKLEKEHLDIGNNHIKNMLPFSEVYKIFK